MFKPSVILGELSKTDDDSTGKLKRFMKTQGKPAEERTYDVERGEGDLFGKEAYQLSLG
jgi:hypothetical protein